MYLDACMQRLWWIFRWTVATNGTREWWPAISVCGGSNTTFWTFHGQWNRQVWIATSLRSTVKSMKISSCVHNFTSSTDLKWHIVIVFQGSSSDWLCTTTSCIPQSVSALVVTYEHPNCAWCLVIDCLSLWQTWIQVLLHALWRVVNFPLLMRASLVQCDGHCLEARVLSLFPWGLLCNTRAWERCPGLRVMVAHTTGTNMHFIKFHIPKWTTAIPANAPAPHIEHGFTTLL